MDIKKPPSPEETVVSNPHVHLFDKSFKRYNKKIVNLISKFNDATAALDIIKKVKEPPTLEGTVVSKPSAHLLDKSFNDTTKKNVNLNSKLDYDTAAFKIQDVFRKSFSLKNKNIKKISTKNQERKTYDRATKCSVLFIQTSFRSSIKIKLKIRRDEVNQAFNHKEVIPRLVPRKSDAELRNVYMNTYKNRDKLNL